MTTTTTREGLVREIRRWDLVALVLNSIMGAGIFGLPALVFGLSGSYSLLAYGVCAVCVILMILCFAEVSSRFASTGGPYLYAYEAFGSLVGFQMGWLLWLARLTAFAALLNLWIDYLGFFVPAASAGLARAIIITVIVAILTVLNVRGVRASSLFNDVFTVSKLVPLLLLILVGLFFVEAQNFDFEAVPSFGSFSESVLLLVFAFSGFEMVVIPAGEARQPGRHTPFALLTGIAIIVVLYLLIQFVAIGTLPELAASSRPLADAGARVLGPFGGAIISAGALISITGTLNVIVLVSPRLLFAMAERGQLPRTLAATHPRFHTPHVAIIVSTAVMLVLTIEGSFISALTISTVIRLFTYAATCLALPVFRRKADAPPAEFTVPAGVLVTFLALLLVAWLLTNSGANELGLTALAVGIGLVIYFVFRGGSGSGTRLQAP